MSDFNGHRNMGTLVAFLIGIISYGLYTKGIIPLRTMPVAMTVGFVFSLFPDIDVKSKASMLIYSMVMCAGIYLYYIGEYKILSIMVLASIVPQLTKHRGVFHSVIASLVVPSIAFLFHYYGIYSIQETILVYVSGVVGYNSHLVADRR